MRKRDTDTDIQANRQTEKQIDYENHEKVRQID
jgi:hypothetical protein